MKTIARTVALILFFAGVWPYLGHADEIKVGGIGAGLATMRLLADAFVKTRPDTTITVLPSLGSSGGIKAVAAGAISLAVSGRDLTEAERRQGLVAVEVARTPFVFTLSANNKVEAITLPQLVDIYSGKTTQWPDGSTIRIVLRPVGDTDGEMIRSMSPALARAMQQAHARPGMLIAVTDQDVQENIEHIPGALGATSLGQIVAERRQLKALTLEGVRPSPQSLASGRYRYARILYLIASPKTPATAHGFAEFVRSQAGREVLGQTGYWVR